MFEPTNSGVALSMCLVAALGWATLNNAVLCTHSPPGVFHLNLMVWRFLWTFVFSLFLGSGLCPPNKDSMWKNLGDVLSAPATTMLCRLGATFVAGFTDMLFQIFILGGVSAAGLSNSIPLQIGLATISGSFLTYLIERRGNPFFFIPGLFLNLLAVAFNSITYGYLRKDQSNGVKDESLLEENTPKVVNQISDNRIDENKNQCVEVTRHLCSFMAMFWSPSTAIAGQSPHGFNSYSTALLVSFWSMITAAPFSYLSMRHPFMGEPVGFQEWIHTGWRDLLPAIWGGFCWAVGTFGYCLGAPKIGFAIAYVLSQSTPFISSLYAIFWWKEFKLATKRTWIFETLMLITMALSVVCLCFAKASN